MSEIDDNEALSPEMAAEAAAAPESEAVAPEATSDETEDLAQALDAANAEAAKMKEQLLRAMAEVENMRRRTQKEIEDARRFAVDSFAKEILVVADNFSRALESMPPSVEEPLLKQLITGVEATGRQMMAVFEKFGIKPIDPEGQVFDPHFHRVMMEVEDLSKPAGTVVQVVQKGYLIHGRLLREALVAVSKGGPAAHHLDTSA